MDSKAKESPEDADHIEILENLSKDLKQISQSFHDMQGTYLFILTPKMTDIMEEQLRKKFSDALRKISDK